MKNKIKALRNEKNMSQEDLAISSNVSRTIISGLENGTIDNTSSNTMEKIAKALDEKIETIFFSD